MTYKKSLLNYVSDLAAEIGNSKPGFMHIEVQHDTWCKLLTGKGDCNCNPTISRSAFMPSKGKTH
jgi:hypothetical protein